MRPGESRAGGSPSEAELTERLQAILASDEFRPRVSDDIGRWLERLDEVLRAWRGLEGETTRVLSFVVLVSALAFIFWLVCKVFALRGLTLAPSTGNKSPAQAGPLPPTSALAQARALADAGRLREAARVLQAAVLHAACAERNLAWRPELSDGEWLELLRPSAEVVALSRSTERLAFGPDPTRAVFDASEQAARALLATFGAAQP
jgi:hypothetical protein